MTFHIILLYIYNVVLKMVLVVPPTKVKEFFKKVLDTK